MKCSSCLRFQLFGVETFSSLPKGQSDGRDLARQRQTRHLRLHSFVEQTHIKFAERPHPTAGSSRRSLENLFHLMVVILIQTTDLLGFLGALQLSADKAVLPTIVRFNAQSSKVKVPFLLETDGNHPESAAHPSTSSFNPLKRGVLS